MKRVLPRSRSSWGLPLARSRFKSSATERIVSISSRVKSLTVRKSRPRRLVVFMEYSLQNVMELGIDDRQAHGRSSVVGAETSCSQRTAILAGPRIRSARALHVGVRQHELPDQHDEIVERSDEPAQGSHRGAVVVELIDAHTVLVVRLAEILELPVQLVDDLIV